jgi:hypothetical protein
MIILILICFQYSFAENIQAPQIQRNSTQSQINNLYIETVKPIFQKKCFDCHSNQTIYPWYYIIPFIKNSMDEHIEEGMNNFDLSDDYPFSGVGDSEDNILERLRETIISNDMPMLSYVIFHWDSSLTDVDKNIILSWIDSSRNLLKK